ncbi:acyl-CoA desaturase [Gammaproteobacteria bacterium]|nr:acyl-CoA desaturase [Gammaproteobacteria bacterium]
MFFSSIKAWFDNSHIEENIDNSENINWLRCTPFIILHVSLIFGIFAPITTAGIVLCLASYFIRMFAITAFFHRYFAHKTFTTSKTIETLFALIGTSAAQRGPIWWASHHRGHHKYSDTQLDEHSPEKKGFIKSHMLWFMCNRNFHTRKSFVKDLLRKKNLQFIDRFDGIIPLCFLALLALLGYCAQHFTNINLTPFTAMYWGFAVPTVLLLHATFSINSFGHTFGKKVYKTGDGSRNNWVLAIITLGEGWHNNHHHWPISAKQGFKWQQIDISYYCLLLMKKLRLIKDIKIVPMSKLDKNKICVSQL